MYATVQDMINAFGVDECVSLTDRDFRSVIDEPVMNVALTRASAEIDSYLCGRYPVPWTDEPRVLVGRCCDIARFFLTGSRTQNTEEIRERYDDALRYLERVADGRITLGRNDTGAVILSGTGAQFSSGGKVFGRDQTDNGAY